jgi:nicotinamidase-related amidase
MIIDAEPLPYECDLENTGLLIIDMQRDFLDLDGFGHRMGYDASQLRQVIAPIQTVLASARSVGLFTIYTREGFRPDLSNLAPTKRRRSYNEIGIGCSGPLGRALIQGEPGFDIIAELHPQPGEPIIDKPGHGAFYATDLEAILHARRIWSLIICGVVTEVCVQSTLREAKDRGYDCLTLEDCVSSYYPVFKQASLEMIKAQNGVFGGVSTSQKVIHAINELHSKS